MKQTFLQTEAPFYEELVRYVGLNRKGFHTPGHRGGRSLGEAWVGSGLLALDLTEVSGLEWEYALTEAQRLAAEFYQADASFFLVQGATQGIQGAVLGCFAPGDKVLVARNCHISVLNAVILADVEPVYVQTDFLSQWGLPLGINLQALQQALDRHPDAKGLIATNPSYQGVAAPVSLYRKMIRERLLIIDEAHGGHLGWCGLPGRDAGPEADLWVQGTHKFLGSLTQTGMLHLHTARILPETVRKGLGLISSTSPSYILLAALDVNRRFLAMEGKSLFERNAPWINRLHADLEGIDGLRVLNAVALAGTGYELDPWKLTCSCIDLGLSGYETERILQNQYGIQVEYADLYQVTCFLSPWQERKDLIDLVEAFQGISRQYCKGKSGTEVYWGKEWPGIPPQRLNPRTALYAPYQEVFLSEAAGRIAAGVIAPYPPGIPLIAPGEVITEDMVALIEKLLDLGGRVNGVDPQTRIIRCVEGG